MEKFDRGGIAAVLAADADFQPWFHTSPALDAQRDKFTNTILVDRNERIGFKNLLLDVVGEDRRCIIAAQAETGLRQVVGAERKEFGAVVTLGDLVGFQGGAWQLDHGTDGVGELSAGFSFNRCSHGSNDRC
jgi:hypothetical protein